MICSSILDEKAVRDTFADLERMQNRKKWGPWRIVPSADGREYLVFRYQKGGEYSVPLDELTGRTLEEWLEHLVQKVWMTPELMGWFIKAIFGPRGHGNDD